MIFNSDINIEEFNFSSDKTILDQIYNLNQCNTPEVGSLDSYNDLIGLLDKSFVNYFLFNGDEVIGFIVCFRENTAYKSKNYKFFSSIKDQFLYIDRVVIKSSFREKGIGTNLYKFVEKIAKKMTFLFVVRLIQSLKIFLQYNFIKNLVLKKLGNIILMITQSHIL
ncbi:MAG: GNAT family N-acetyltransferase [Gammaproteobacteria bacterium]